MVFQTKIENEEDWNNVVFNSPGMIQVIEVHQKWCGPCKPIVSSLQRLFFELDNVPLKFYTACADDIDSLSDLVGDCKPLFLFFKDGETFYEIEGVSLQMFTDKLEELAREYNRDAAPKNRVDVQIGMPSAATSAP